MSNFRKDYFVVAAENETPREYLNNAKFNYVILDQGTEPVCWGDGSGPVIYGSRAEAKADFISGDKIITELEFLRRFCREEYLKYKNTK